MVRALILPLTIYVSSLITLATDLSEQADAYYKSGKAHFLSLNYKDAISDFQNAISTWQDSPKDNKANLLNSRTYLVNALWNNCEADEAEKLAKSCYDQLMSSAKSKDPVLIDTYLLLAEFYLNMDYSHERSDMCIEISADIIARNYSSDIFYNGILYYLKGHSDFLKRDWENALNYLERSAVLLRKAPQLSRYESLNQVYLTSIQYRKYGDYRKTIDYGNRIAESKDITDEARASLYYVIGRAYLRLSDNVSAGEFFNKALKTASTTKSAYNVIAVIRSNYHLAQMYEGDRTKRLNYLNNALEAAHQMSYRGKEAAMMNHSIARCYYEERNYAETLKFLQQALIAASEEYNDTSVMSNPPADKLRQYGILVSILSLKAYSIPHINTNDKSYAKFGLQCLEQALSLLDKELAYTDMENSGLQRAAVRRDILTDAAAYANYIYRYTGEEEYAEKAFYFSENGKAQVLKKYTEKPGILRQCGVPDSIIESTEKLGNEILETENRLALFLDLKKDATRLSDRLNYLYDQRDFQNFEIGQKYPMYQKAQFNMRVPRIDEIRTVLGDDQALVEYEIRNYELITFVITKDDFYQYSQQNTRNTEKHIENLRQLISVNPALYNNDTAFSSLVNSSNYLYDILIKPIHKKIKGKRLVIIPHGSLLLVPFEVLIRDSGDGKADYRKLHWLINEFPVTYAFSASYLFDEPGRESGKGMAAFVPGYGKVDSLERLEGAEEEARFLKRKMNFRVFSGKRAREKNFRNKASDYRVLHIAAHTRIDEKRPDLSCFIFPDSKGAESDGCLHVFEIKQMKLNAQLAVLSGCNTGYGTYKVSDGMLSLARSFYFTGIRMVAFTLWSVSDKAAEDIATLFYREIHDGSPPDIALRKSKLQFIKSADPVKAHPYFWAGFIVTGRSQPIPLDHDFRMTFILVLLGGIIVSYTARRILKKTQKS